MKDYIEERAVEIASYIIETKATVRQTAKKFGISKSTVHMDVTKQNGCKGLLKNSRQPLFILCIPKGSQIAIRRFIRDTLQNAQRQYVVLEKIPYESPFSIVYGIRYRYFLACSRDTCRCCFIRSPALAYSPFK